MAVNQALIEQLMKLDDQERLEVAQLLLSTVDDQDNLADDERARLHAALVVLTDDPVLPVDSIPEIHRIGGVEPRLLDLGKSPAVDSSSSLPAQNHSR